MTKTAAWTNKSVKMFAGDKDPVQKMEETARNTVLRALDAGWNGPPFDPIQLAGYLNLGLTPNNDIPDARTISNERGELIIEFNPARPRGRMRFSVAHEIAHSFFEDCAEAIRNRETKKRHSSLTDNWQLEMLCNLGAAELIMPIGSNPKFENGNLSLYELMEFRKEYEVSTEALLVRYIKLTNRPIAMFCANHIDSGTSKGHYRIDYMIPSKRWPYQTLQNVILDKTDVLSECTAVGYISSGKEKWADMPKKLNIECVGLPHYPGALFPRVAGFVSVPDARSHKLNTINYHRGDATHPGGTGKRIIAHIVNDATPNWGGRGFAVALKRRYGHVQSDFKNWVEAFRDEFRLGKSYLSPINEDISCFSMVAQRGYKSTGYPLIRYDALRECLETLSDVAVENNASIHMPRIGTGNAGGRWEIIQELLSDILLSKGIEVNVYDFE